MNLQLSSNLKPRRGTPTRTLARLTNDQLVARYREILRAQAAPNYLPKHLRAAPDANTRHQGTLLQSERVRIQKLAARRGLDLCANQIANEIRAQFTTPEPRAERDIETGDKVHVTYRDPASGETVETNGEVIRLEWSQAVGGIYHTRLDDGRVIYVSRRNLKRISN